jgi:hypothetical protein
LPAPPKFSDHVVSGSPSVSACGAPIALEAASVDSTEVAAWLGSSSARRVAFTARAPSRSETLRRCTLAAFSSKS